MKTFGKVGALFIMVIGIAAVNLSAQELEKYPTRPVNMSFAFAAGGSTDLTCRAISSIASKYFSQPIICTPKPGGAGLVALQYLASSKPDGYTYHLGRCGEMSIAPFIEKMPFDMEKDFIPVGQAAVDIIVFAVYAKTPWKTIEDLIEDAKKEPGKIKFACSSSTAMVRLALEKFCHQVGIKLTCVPFKGSGPAAIAVSGGHVPVLTASVSETLPSVQRGDLRILLTCTEKRVKEYPDVPCAKEKGYDVTFGTWNTVFAAKGTPPIILSKFEAMLKKVVEDSEFVSSMTNLGSEPSFISSKDFVEYWRSERIWVGDLVKRLGLI